PPPPAAQFLYDLGLVNETSPDQQLIQRDPALKDKFDAFADCTPSSLPIHLLPRQSTFAASAAKLSQGTPHSILEEFEIDKDVMANIYLSPDPYHNAFPETLDLRRFDSTRTPNAGMSFTSSDDQVFIEHMKPSTPAARIPRWRSRLRHAWLIQVNNTPITSIEDHGLTNEGIPQINLDPLNNRLLLCPPGDDLLHSLPQLQHQGVQKNGGVYVQDEDDVEDVLNLTTQVMKLTHAKLFKQDDWDDWEQSEFLQMDQYEKQFMFGEPVPVESVKDAKKNSFRLVWTYLQKILDGQKKARCTMDGSARNGLTIFGSDVSNAFGEAPPPKQGAFVIPDRAFYQRWTKHKKLPRISPGYVVPVQRAMQGHPESPRLWEKFIDGILKSLGLTPTVHEPCLYHGVIDGKRILFLRQVDDFACAAPDARTADILLDMIDEKLSIPIKRQGPVTLFNGFDVDQTKYYVKVSVESYLTRICEKHMETWMKDTPILKDRPLPLPSTKDFMKELLSAEGDPDPKVQAKLAKSMTSSYRNLVGEMTYAMITCRPDISFATVKCAQANAAPAEVHYRAAKHCLRYLHATRTDGIYFWRPRPLDHLPDKGAPSIFSNPGDLLPFGRCPHGPYDLHAFTDADWAACPKTRRSFTGICLRLAGGTVAYTFRLDQSTTNSTNPHTY
ncbi:hypothetical protein ACHAXR_002756, partial [Thalassiosira sp. AJA248-18]